MIKTANLTEIGVVQGITEVAAYMMSSADKMQERSQKDMTNIKSKRIMNHFFQVEKISDNFLGCIFYCIVYDFLTFT